MCGNNNNNITTIDKLVVMGNTFVPCRRNGGEKVPKLRLTDKVSTEKGKKKKKITTKKRWLADLGHMGISFMCSIAHAISIIDPPLGGSMRGT